MHFGAIGAFHADLGNGCAVVLVFSAVRYSAVTFAPGGGTRIQAELIFRPWPANNAGVCSAAVISKASFVMFMSDSGAKNLAQGVAKVAWCLWWR